MLHRADGTVTHPPTDAFVTHALANFGYAIRVSEGRAVGYMTLCDGTTTRPLGTGSTRPSRTSGSPMPIGARVSLLRFWISCRSGPT